MALLNSFKKEKVKKISFRITVFFKEGYELDKCLLTVKALNQRDAESKARVFIGDDENIERIEVVGGKTFGS